MDNKKLNEEVDKTLGSLDGLDRAKAKPFFYTRLTARMEREVVKEPVMRWQWAIATLIIIMVLNGLSYLSFWPSSAEEDEIEWLAEEYSVEYQDLYNQDLEP